MSKFLAKITTGKIVEPLFGIIYGVEGIGKTTFGAQMPKVIFMGPEAATKFDVARFPRPESFQDVIEQIKELTEQTHEFKSLCVDSLDWVEHLLHDDMKKKEKVNAVEDCGGGYGKWVGVANKHWLELIKALQDLREKRKMNIVLLAHFHVKTFHDPSTPLPYDRYMMKMNEKAAAIFREAVDFVFFANFKTQSFSADSRAKKGRGIGGEARIVYTEKRPSHDAKNRFSLPVEMPFDYNEIAKKINESDADQLTTLQNEVRDIIVDIQDADLKKKAEETFEKTKGNLESLKLVKNRLVAALGDK